MNVHRSSSRPTGFARNQTQKTELRPQEATIQEDHMRSASLVLAAMAGLAASTFALPASAFTPNSSSGIRAATETVDPLASVHCRPFKHRSYNHPCSYGCRGGGISVHEGVSIHERGGVRGRVSVHERDRRSEEHTSELQSHSFIS